VMLRQSAMRPGDCERRHLTAFHDFTFP